MSNFRQTYYGKLGYKGVEEKGKLEFLLDERKVKDLGKLKLFAEEFTVHSSHRLTLWSYLSNLCPIYPNSHKYVLEQRTEEFSDLKSAVVKIKLVDESTASFEHILYWMWMLQTNRLPFGNKVAPTEDQPFLEIAKILRQIFPDSTSEVYWISKYIFDMGAQADTDALIAQTYNELENIDGNLLRELEKKNILARLPLSRWLQRCFAGVVIHTSLTRIWDKLFGGTPKILVYLYIKMLQYLREKLINCDSYEKAERTFDIFISDQEAADRIVNKAIEMMFEINNKK